jgi:hypothetical protein
MITIKKKMAVHSLQIDEHGVRVSLGDEESQSFHERFDVSFPLQRKQVAELAIALSEGGEHADLTIQIGPEQESEDPKEVTK